MQIVIPMAGEGRRFKEAGYTEPKPFIKVNGKIMIERVIENLPPHDQLVLICKVEHLPRLEHIDAIKIPVGSTTEGAACTVLLAKAHIDNHDELLIANADQLIEYNSRNWEVLRQQSGAKGVIWLFESDGSDKWSYAKVSKYYQITGVAEKKVISEYATCGVYYWRQGQDFVHHAEEMIKENERVNGEFYVCPVFNGLLLRAHLVLPFFVDYMSGLGTPEDLQAYLRRHK